MKDFRMKDFRMKDFRMKDFRIAHRPSEDDKLLSTEWYRENT